MKRLAMASSSLAQGAILLLDKPNGSNCRAASAVSLEVYKKWCGIEPSSAGQAGGGAPGGKGHGRNKRRRGNQPDMKMGHAGTLDPMATGCLPVLLGQCTRLQDLLPIDEKRYIAHIKLGVKTDSDDADGAILNTDEAFKGLPVEGFDLEAILRSFRGTITQIPPIYSAIHVDGKRAYDLARAGETPSMPPRQVRIINLSGKIVDPFTILIDVTCGTGTYVRTLGTDIARAVGTEGHLSMLRRVASGLFQVPLERKEVEGDIVRVISFDDAIRSIAPVIDLTAKPEAQENLKTGRSGHLFRDLHSIVQQKPGEPTLVALQWDGDFRALVKVDFDKKGVSSLCHFKPEETIPFLPPLIPRAFQPPLEDESNELELRVAQFNILADGLSGSHPDLGMFDGVPYAALEWKGRADRIVKELSRAKPHLIGMQEVDHFEELLQALGKQYSGSFMPKVNSPCLASTSKPDGCAIIFDTRRFVKVNSEDVSFRLGETDSQVACALILKDTVTDKTFVVCSAHLKALKDPNGEGEAIRVRQAGVILTKLGEMQKQYGAHDVILCTDLNGTPTGDAYGVLAKSYQSAMKAQLGGEEPAYTTAKKRGDHAVRHTIDYIFTSGVTLVPKRHLVVPTLGDNYLPSFAYPSDHFMLCVGFEPK